MLNQAEQEILQTLLNNKLLMAVVYKVFSSVVESNLPKISENDNNLIIGEKYRAYDTNKEIIEQSFRQLEIYRKIKNLKETLNRAR